jgi:hypothetical protein
MNQLWFFDIAVTTRPWWATGHHFLVIAYRILAKNVIYQELGGEYSDRRAHDRTIRRRHVKHL